MHLISMILRINAMNMHKAGSTGFIRTSSVIKEYLKNNVVIKPIWTFPRKTTSSANY